MLFVPHGQTLTARRLYLRASHFQRSLSRWEAIPATPDLREMREEVAFNLCALLTLLCRSGAGVASNTASVCSHFQIIA